MNTLIFPRALRVAARTFANRPKIVGEILVALCTEEHKQKLSEVQEYILAECQDEIKTRLAARAKNTEAKRRSRTNKEA